MSFVLLQPLVANSANAYSCLEDDVLFYIDSLLVI